VNVDERHVGLQISGRSESFGEGRSHSDDREPVALQQPTRSVAEGLGVIDD
jgi:hypothetical protein